jgi:transcriptional regulator with XRE-family HTH domain
MHVMANPIDIGRRLRATREAFGLNGTEFAARSTLKQNAYSQYETGARLLTVTASMKLCATYGLTMDWLYRGDLSGLPHSLAIKLVSVEAQRAEQR